MRAERVLQRTDHLIDGPGRRLREQTLDELHLRIGRDVSAFVREDVESLMAAVHAELSVMTEEPEILPGGREEVPVVVLVFTDLALEEHVHAGDARLPKRVEDELSSGRPAFVADSVARSYARIVACRRLASPLVVACSLIASAVSKKYFAAVR